MIEYICRCDICRKELETETKQTPFGEIEVIKNVGKTKEINTDALFQHLCKECALSIDNTILKEKMRLLSMLNTSKTRRKKQIKK